MIKLIPEKMIRRVDVLGRVTVPKGIRNKYDWEEGKVLETFTLFDEEGKFYVAFRECEDPVIIAAEKAKDEKKKAAKKMKKGEKATRVVVEEEEENVDN